MAASSYEETKILIRSNFQMTAPPLRMYVSGLNVPIGLMQVNTDADIAGTVISNYNISKLSVRVYSSSGTAVLTYNTNPNSLMVELSSFKNSIDISELSAGEYTFVVNATANGVSKDLVRNVFRLGDTNSNMSTEDIDKLVAFASDYSNILTFHYSDHNSVLGNMGADEIALMAINSRNKMFIGQLQKWLTGENQYMVQLYKKEIIAVRSVDRNMKTYFFDLVPIQVLIVVSTKNFAPSVYIISNSLDLLHLVW